MGSGGFLFPGLTHYMPPLLGYTTPWSGLGQNLHTTQGTMCEQFELNFYRCVEAFGLHASKRKCDLEYRDLLECIYQRKQMSRWYTMRKERMKQFAEGKRDRPWMAEPLYQYEFWPCWYDHENRNRVRQFN